MVDAIDRALWDFQDDAVRQGLRHIGFLLLMPTGTGKTVTSLAIVNRRFRRGQVNRVMVVVPLQLIEQWAEVIAAWLPHARVTTDALDMPRHDDDLVFFICHYEWARGNKQLKMLRKKPFDMIIADEIHKMKSRSSKQSRRLWLVGKTAMYRIGLTGTPIEGNELDFWAQVRFVNDELFGDSYPEFSEMWTRASGFMGKERKLKNHMAAKFVKRVASISYYVDKKEVLDLPPVIHQHVPVMMTGKQLRAYRELERDMVLEIGDTVIATPLVVTQMIRLQQLAGGYVTDHDGEDHYVGTAKIDVLREILIGHPQPIVIYARFTWEIHTIRALVVSLKRQPSIITGKIKEGSKSKFDVMILQVSVTAGLDDMQHVAATGVFYSKTFSRIQLTQATGRLDRGGQKAEQVLFIHLQAKNTIDDDLENAIQAKGDISHNALQFFRRRMSMAKDAPKTVDKSKGKAPAPAPAAKETAKPAHKYSIQTLVDETDIEQPKLRVLLRGLKIGKNGGRYGWDTKADFDAVKKQVVEANKNTPARGRPSGKKNEAPASAASDKGTKTKEAPKADKSKTTPAATGKKKAA